ncbi:MAG: oligosaccharide flippase family protein [Cyclobacteriaceae bacterium]|nr:oligosaccharide flippase family protein [Cyclobacteriaceae bacterium]
MIKERLKFLIKDTALYGVANAISKFIIFLTLPIIVNVISPIDFGVWNLLTIVGVIISAIVIFGMDSAVIRYYYDDSGFEYHRKVFSHGLVVQICIILIFLSIAFVSSDFFLKTIKLNEQSIFSLQLIFVWIPANVLTQYSQNWFKWTFQRVKFLIMSIGLAVLNLLFLILCTHYYYLDLEMILLANAISYWLFVVIGLFWCRKYIQFRIDKVLLNKLLIFGFPMMLVMLVGNLTSSLDRLFLARFLTGEQLGIFSFSQKLGVIMTVVVMAFQTAFGPFSFSIWEKPDAKDIFAKFQTYYIMATGVIAIGICAFIKPLIMILGNELYLKSSQYLFLFAEAIIIYGLYSFASLGISYSKKMTQNLIALCVGLLVNFVCNYLLVPVIFEYGALIGFLLGNVTLVITAYLFSRKSYPVKYFYLKDAIHLIFLFGVLAITNISMLDSIYWDAFLKLSVLLPFYFLLSYWMLDKASKEFIISRIGNVV